MLDRFDRALADLRFDDAENLLAEAVGEEADDLRSTLDRRRQAAFEEARRLGDRIIEHGSAYDYDTLLPIRLDPRTEPLLSLLSEPARRRVDSYLGEAESWERNRREANDRRLREARQALNRLDLQLARGLLARVDERFLPDDAASERDSLLLELESRTMELEELSALGQSIAAEQPPPKYRWWRGRRR